MNAAVPPSSVTVHAPGRVNLIGEHTDYNDGFVLPMAIEVGVTITAQPRGDRLVRMKTDRMVGRLEVSLSEPLTRGEPSWGNYVRGVLAGFQRLGVAVPGFDAEITGNLPTGGGLSSSAALEVATATLIEALTGHLLDLEDKALLCQRAEHEFAGVPCGIMDQFAVVFGRAGHALLLDCRSRERTLVPMPGGEVTVLIINTMVKHALTDGGYAKRRDQCYAAAAALGVPMLREATLAQLEAARDSMPPGDFLRARHVISENTRTLAAVEALQRADWSTLGRLMYESHASLRGDFEVSCAELDAVVDIAGQLGEAGGVMGCRMTGGGFGGCAVALVRADCLPAIQAHLEAEYERRTGIRPVMLATRPADGARRLT